MPYCGGIGTCATSAGAGGGPGGGGGGGSGPGGAEGIERPLLLRPLGSLELVVHPMRTGAPLRLGEPAVEPEESVRLAGPRPLAERVESPGADAAIEPRRGMPLVLIGGGPG